MLTASPERPAAILFVDDEINILKALARLLRNEPYAVHLASSAEEAFRILESTPVQVVISDQRMPGTCGVEFLSRTRKRWPHAIRILLTGYAEVTVVVEAINHGEIYRLVTKPWNDDGLRATIRQALDTYLMRREISRTRRSRR
jgi:DNA-binding NtrC family response regulator